ncbi:MAG: MotA/TolQ/ExbB proton channel family protein, partial [Bacteroidetes bacterium]|nr:MotA/TolQ/ExbB proton channel family protein [Bacteroidota bacterium]
MLLNLLLQITTCEAGVNEEGTEEVVPTEETLSIIELLSSGGWYIMIPLAILSVIAIYIFIERFLAIQKASKEDPQFMNQIRDFIH